MSTGTRPVSFRLDEQYLERLKKEAAKYGMSTGDYARRIVIDTLEDTDKRRMEDAMREVKREIGDLRTDLATSVVALLIGAGHVENNEAREWVQTNLKIK